MDNDDRERGLVKVFAAVGATGAGLAVGMGLGPGAGALTGAALMHPVELLLEKGRQLFYRNANTVVGVAAEGLGMTDEEFTDHAAASDKRLLFTANAIWAGSRTAWEHKLRTLGKVLRDGLADDARLDELPLVLAAIDAIEVPHVRVLGYLERATSELPSNIAGTSTAKLREDLPAYSTGLASILATLQGHGLIVAPGAFLGSDEGPEHNQLWRSTPFTDTVLQYILEDGDEISA